MNRHHDMRFGAECRDDGSVRFRLWAPAAHRVDLCLGHSVEPLALQPNGGGWFELITDAAKVGTRYKFQIDGGQEAPDPASRFQPEDVHGPSEVIGARNFDWQDDTWRGRPWHQAVIYELHVGTFTPAGTFSAVKDRLDYLVDLGITAIELMPLADFPGKRNWGYDGVLPFAPDSVYGRPEDLKELIQSAHARRLMVFLDVVYNHFGPEGNYLAHYSPQFFTARHTTPWGNAINFDGAESRVVRDFFIDNALYWLKEYHFDGLRLDAVHSIVDDSTPHILDELARTVRNVVDPGRYVHLILENERNQATYLRRDEQCRVREYDAQWNDDIHHALHVLTTGERDGYYSDYSSHPLDQLGRCLVSGFAYQGDISLYGNSRRRGEPTDGLPLTAFISFLQNHDQIGNRAFGERLTTLLSEPRPIRAAIELLLIAPSVPLFFMGQEFGAQTPFLFFCNFEKDLAETVSAGRRNEFARFTRFSDPATRAGIPDPNADSTFESSRIDWQELDDPRHQAWVRLHRELLQIRSQYISPLIANACAVKATYEVLKGSGLKVDWTFSSNAQLTLLANLGAASLSGLTVPSASTIFASDQETRDALKHSTLPPWSLSWFLGI